MKAKGLMTAIRALSLLCLIPTETFADILGIRCDAIRAGRTPSEDFRLPLSARHLR